MASSEFVEHASPHHRYTRAHYLATPSASQSCFPIEALKLGTKQNDVTVADPCQKVRIYPGVRDRYV